MRGKYSDALNGTIRLASPFDAPFDRMFNNLALRMPPSAQVQDAKQNLYRRRYIPIDATNTPKAPAIKINSKQPIHAQPTEVAQLPNAGVYRRKTYLVGGMIP